MKPFPVRVPAGLRLVVTPNGPRLSHLPVTLEPLPAALDAALPGRPAIPPRVRRRSATDRVTDAVEGIRRVHEGDVAVISCPVIPIEPTPTAAELLPALERSALKGVGLARRRRRAARALASDRAEERAAELAAAARARQQLAQESCDVWWARLLDAEPVVVHSWAAAAFDRAGIPAAVIDIDGHEITVVTTVTGVDTVPTRMPSQDAKGRPSTRSILKGERSTLYSALVCGHAVLTLRQVFALLPGATTVRLIVLVDSGIGALGLRRVEPILCTVTPRASFLRSVRPESTAAQALRDGCRDVLQNVEGGLLVPIPLDQQEGLRDLLHAVDRV